MWQRFAIGIALMLLASASLSAAQGGGTHAEMLAALVNRLASANAKVLITCPGRGYRNRFSRLLQSSGFDFTETNVPFTKDEAPPFRGRLLCYKRAM